MLKKLSKDSAQYFVMVRASKNQVNELGKVRDGQKVELQRLPDLIRGVVEAHKHILEVQISSPPTKLFDH